MPKYLFYKPLKYLAKILSFGQNIDIYAAAGRSATWSSAPAGFSKNPITFLFVNILKPNLEVRLDIISSTNP